METITTLRQEIIEGYLDYVLTQGKRPVSAYAFVKTLGLTEESFYQQFANFNAIEQAIWVEIFEATYNRLKAEETYKSYSAREKLLAFYFTWLEMLLPRRSYVEWLLYTSNSQARTLGTPTVFQPLKEKFLRLADEIVNEGLDKGELVSRPIVTDRYSEALWMQLVYLTRFWAKDTSQGFEDSDAAIEKAVRLSFELMGSNVVDALTDFAKFIWQRR